MSEQKPGKPNDSEPPTGSVPRTHITLAPPPPPEAPRRTATLEFDIGELREQPSSVLELADHHVGPLSHRPNPINTPAQPPPLGQASRDSRLAEARDRHALGDFSGALTILESILEADAADDEASRYADLCRGILTEMYTSRLGSLTLVPIVCVPSDQVRWLSLDHRAGFLLSLMDGHSSLEEILDVSGMRRLDALMLLHDLREQRVIDLTETQGE